MSEYIRLKEANCKNCYKCIRHCPVKSISFSENQAQIISDACILCGECFIVCPQDAKIIRDDTDRAKSILAGDGPVYASVAPSFAAAFPGIGIRGMETALQALGFDAAEETALGATLVKKQYEELIRAGEHEVLISSCCPSVNLLICRHFPAALPYLAPVVSPLEAHSRDIKRRCPEAKVIFIGPCISKKFEAEEEGSGVDCALTFDELAAWFAAAGVTPEQEPDEAAPGRTRIFPTAGGILKSMDCDSETYRYLSVDGTENCKAALRDILDGRLGRCFVEMSACTGSCVGGPASIRPRRAPLRSAIAVTNYAGSEDFPVETPPADALTRDFSALPRAEKLPSELELREILLKMGKKTPEYELNCGSCGYDTCREKAVAIYQGKADLTMCLPFLRDKAETFSSNILKNSPNGILVLDDELRVQQANPAALRLLNLSSAADIVGDAVVRVLDPAIFIDVRSSGGIRGAKTYLAEYGKYVEQTVVFDSTYRLILCILRDVTDEETARQRKEEISAKTIEIADKVIDKQMRVVQEIASLLGETTAETKVALTKLKESLEDE